MACFMLLIIVVSFWSLNILRIGFKRSFFELFFLYFAHIKFLDNSFHYENSGIYCCSHK